MVAKAAAQILLQRAPVSVGIAAAVADEDLRLPGVSRVTGFRTGSRGGWAMCSQMKVEIK